jgi:hypothetical protein
MNTVRQTLGDYALFTTLSGGREEQFSVNYECHYQEPYMVTQEAGRVITQQEIKKKQDVERLNNPYLLHPEETPRKATSCSPRTTTATPPTTGWLPC